MSETGITSIHVTFPTPVEVPDETYRTLIELIDEICGGYEAANPDRVMWPAGIGGAPRGNWFVDDDFDFDMSVLSFECAERERFDGEQDQAEQPRWRDVLAAMDDYNSIVRSANHIAERQGEETNWDAFGKRVQEVLRQHHRTWRHFSPWLRETLEKSRGDAMLAARKEPTP